jgi:hypothetical protein
VAAVPITVVEHQTGSWAPADAANVAVRFTRPGLFASIGAALGMADIEAGDAAFDDRWRVRSEDPDGARRLLVPALTAYLATLPPELDRAGFELHQGQALVVVPGERTEHLPVLISCLAGLIERLPS